MTVYKFTNFAMSVLTEGVAADATLLKIRAEDADLFPVIGVGEAFFATLWDRVETPEIVEVTARAGELLTVVRGVDGSAANQWLGGTPIRVALTAGLFDAIRATNLTYVLSGVAAGHFLVYDAADLRWENRAPTISLITGLQTALDDLAVDIASHSHVAEDIDGGDPLFDTVRASSSYTLADAYNLNNLTTIGYFHVLDPTNGPAVGEYVIENIEFDDTSMIQFASLIGVDVYTGFVRVKNAGVWSVWTPLPTADHNHDTRYFTESEADGRFARLGAINLFSTRNQFTRPAGETGYLIQANLLGGVNWAGFRMKTGDAIAFDMWNLAGDKVIEIEPEDLTATFTDVTLSGLASVSSAAYTGSSFTGATGAVAGTRGLVPLPAAGDQKKSLLGNGTWGLAENKIYKTVTTTRTGTDVLADDPHLTFTIEASKDYAFEMDVFYSSPASADFQFGFTGPAAPTLVQIAVDVMRPGQNISSDDAKASSYASYVASQAVLNASSAEDGYLRVRGIIHNGATAGAVHFLWAQNSSDAGNTKVLKGSSVKVMEVV